MNNAIISATCESCGWSDEMPFDPATLGDKEDTVDILQNLHNEASLEEYFADCQEPITWCID